MGKWRKKKLMISFDLNYFKREKMLWCLREKSTNLKFGGAQERILMHMYWRKRKCKRQTQFSI